MQTPVTISYDYRCPFAKNLHLHLVTALRDASDLAIDFAPWTMSQNHRADGAPDVWDDPNKDSELLALAASVSIRDEQPEKFLAAHEALFRARHERGVRLVTIDELTDILAPLGVDMTLVQRDIDSRRPHVVIGETFQEFERLDAFGVPTIVTGAGDGVFVRYMEPPTGDSAASLKIVSDLIVMATSHPAINEFKHTKVPF